MTGPADLGALLAEAGALGRPEWRPVLAYTAALHARSVRPPAGPLEEPWEEIGPGYIARAFGHWDLVHQVLDVLPTAPEHAAGQLRNLLRLVDASGFLPALARLVDGEVQLATRQTCPPVWPVAVEAYARTPGADPALLRLAFGAARRQIAWFERERRAADGGFFYLDAVTRQWESGVDEGVRFLGAPAGPRTCVDATSHVLMLCDHAASWADRLGEDGAAPAALAADLRDLIRASLFDDSTGLFFDSWLMDRSGDPNPEERPLTLEGMWPVVAGAATPGQAARVIDGHLLAPHRFLTPHPLATVARGDPRFELRMWRGPAWNSMTHWAAQGCLRYGRPDAARLLLERALDASAAWYARTGTIWEFYHPDGGHPEALQRKPHRSAAGPCHTYLGHNPLLAMARLWARCAP